MKFRWSILMTAAVLSTLAISGAALADRGSGHFGGRGGWHSSHGLGHVGAFIGGTIVAGALLAPWYYRGPYYHSAYPTVIEVAPPAPTVYIEQPRASQSAAADAGAWWYYCNESGAYYPYVRECASPWQRVAPTPPVSR